MSDDKHEKSYGQRVSEALAKGEPVPPMPDDALPQLEGLNDLRQMVIATKSLYDAFCEDFSSGQSLYLTQAVMHGTPGSPPNS